MIAFLLVCFLVAGAYALPTPLGIACVAGLGVVWLLTPISQQASADRRSREAVSPDKEREQSVLRP